MRFRVVGDLVAHSGPECEAASAGEFGFELAFEAKENMALGTPVVGEVASRVLDHPDSDRAEVSCPPKSESGFAWVPGSGNGGPIRRPKGYLVQLHVPIMLTHRQCNFTTPQLCCYSVKSVHFERETPVGDLARPQKRSQSSAPRRMNGQETR